MTPAELVRAIRPTASGLEILAECPGSAHLPRVRETSDSATAGTVIHRWIELTTSGVAAGMTRPDAAAAALAEIPPEHREVVAGIDPETLPLDGVAAEVALAWDVESGAVRELGRGMSRADYLAALRPGEVGGIMDAVGWNAESQLAVVIDYKTGWSKQSASSWQQRFYAMAAGAWLGAVEVRTLIVRVRKGDPWYSAHTWDAMALLLAPSEIRDVLERAANPDAGLSVGEHCRWCQSSRMCPAVTEQITALATRDPEHRLAPMTPAQLGEVWTKLEAAKVVLDRMRDDVKRLAASAPIPLGPTDDKGRRRYLGEQSTTRYMLGGDAAYQHLLATRGAEVAEAVAPPSPRSATWGAVTTLAKKLKAAGEYPSIKAAEQALRDELLASGAASRRHYTPIQEYWATPCPVCGEGQAQGRGPCIDCEVAQ